MNFRKFDISRKICDHLLSSNHNEGHRMAVGIVIIFVGVSVSKIHTSYYILHILFDAGGYFIHAVGSIPFIDHLINKTDDTNKKE